MCGNAGRQEAVLDIMLTLDDVMENQEPQDGRATPEAEELHRRVAQALAAADHETRCRMRQIAMCAATRQDHLKYQLIDEVSSSAYAAIAHALFP